jgi:hypothetical protein
MDLRAGSGAASPKEALLGHGGTSGCEGGRSRPLATGGTAAQLVSTP